MQLPRAAVRATAARSDYSKFPPILANSFPKSGTHLLLQILSGLPDTRTYRSFIASQPSVPFRERSHQSHLTLLRRIVPGELAAAHLFYHPQFDTALTEINCVHYFIYRDLRDVVVSEAYYLTFMNPWHRMHPYFARLERMQDRISLAILGLTESNGKLHYPDIGARFRRYSGWLENQNVLSVRFEDLVSSSRSQALERIVDFYRAHTDPSSRNGFNTDNLEAKIDPHKSHTFRQGQVGGWRNQFTPKHMAQFKEVAGDLLIQLGYEKDLNW